MTTTNNPTTNPTPSPAAGRKEMAEYEAVMSTIKQLYGSVTEADDNYYKVRELCQSIAKIFGKDERV